MSSFLDKIRCIYPVVHKDEIDEQLTDEKEYIEQMEDFIRYILNDNDDDFQECYNFSNET